MGKTVVCIALILSNPMPAADQSLWDGNTCRKLAALQSRMGNDVWDDVRHQETLSLSRPFTANKLALKTTIVLTKNSLLGQWHDEFQKYAPQLKVLVYHGSSKLRREFDSGTLDVSKIDVILSTPGTLLPDWLTKIATFHRVIVDESHESCKPSLKVYRSGRRWAVTGTPVVKAFSDLDNQADFLGHGVDHETRPVRPLTDRSDSSGSQAVIKKNDWRVDYGLRLRETASQCTVKTERDAQAAFGRLLGKLQTVMIRHSKSQQIAGDLALALPELGSETMWLTMSAEERVEYRVAKSDAKPKEGFSRRCRVVRVRGTHRC